MFFLFYWESISCKFHRSFYCKKLILRQSICAEKKLSVKHTFSFQLDHYFFNFLLTLSTFEDGELGLDVKSLFKRLYLKVLSI